MGVVQLLSAMARLVLAFALVGVAFAAEAQNVHTKKQSMQKHLSQLLEGVESSDKYSLSQKAKIESLVSKTRMDLEAIHEPEEPKHVNVAEKKAHIKKTLSKLLADVESSDKYSDEKKAKVEELVHKMRADLEKVQEHKVEVQMENHEAAPRQTVAEKKEHIKKTLSKLLADVERSDEYSDEKKAKVEELVHKMREDLEKVGKHEKAEKPPTVAEKKAKISKTLSKLLADVETSDKYSDEKKAKVEEIIHKMRKDLANVGHAKEAKVPVHKEMERDEDREAKVAAKKQHIQKTLSKLLADVENSDKYSDEKKEKVEELVHK